MRSEAHEEVTASRTGSRRRQREHVSSAPGTIHVRGRRLARAAINTATRRAVPGPPRDLSHAPPAPPCAVPPAPHRAAPNREPSLPHDRPPQMTESARTLQERRSDPTASTLVRESILCSRSKRATTRYENRYHGQRCRFTLIGAEVLYQLLA